jgi:hypothetical protein
MPRPTLGHFQAFIQWLQGIKRQGCETDQTSLSIAEVKKGGAIPPLPLMFSYACASTIFLQQSQTGSGGFV